MVSLARVDLVARDVAAVLALCDEVALGRAAWKERLSLADVLDARGRVLADDAFSSVLEHLIERGVVVRAGQGHAIDPRWIAPVLEDAQRRGRLERIGDGLARNARSSWHHGRISVKGDLRFALATRRPGALEAAEQMFASRERVSGEGAASLVDALGLAPPRSWLNALSERLRLLYLEQACHSAFVDTALLHAAPRDLIVAGNNAELRARLATLLALEGETSRATELVSDTPTTAWERGALGFVAMVEGDHARARELFAAAADGKRRESAELPSYLAIFDVLLAVTADDDVVVTAGVERLHKLMRRLNRHPTTSLSLEAFVAYRASGRAPEPPDAARTRRSESWIDALIVALVHRWMGSPEAAHDEALMRHAELAALANQRWLARELEAVRSEPADSTLFTMSSAREPWELALDALTKTVDVALAETTTSVPLKVGEVWWTVSLVPSRVVVDAYLVTPRAPKGRKLPFVSLAHDDALPLDAHDRRASAAVAASFDRSPSLPRTVLESFVGHPRVRDASGQRLEVTMGEATVRVDEVSSGAVLSLVPSDFDESGVAVTMSGDKLLVVRRTPAIARALEVVGRSGIEIPRHGFAAMTRALGRLASGFAIDAAHAVPVVDADAASTDERIHVLLYRVGLGLRARLRMFPGGASSAALRPGLPPEDVVVRSAHGIARIRRDLAAERAGVDALLVRCPTLASLPQEGDDRIARDLGTCLELLLELGAAGDDVVVAWPDGQPLRAPTLRGASAVRVRVKGTSAWLTVEGDVEVDEGRVVAMRELLSAMPRGVGRFVPIGNDEYLALTADIQEKLESLTRATSFSSDGRIPGALLPALDGLFEGIDVTFAKAIEQRREAIARANELEVNPHLGLQAELRDYQIDGVTFLVRRTEAGLGACLADDMGLGKTIQALGTLLHRASRGAALVVAPTSVLRNWEDEARRFAPSLEIVPFGSGDRAAAVKAAGTGHVVLVSYALLVAERELLASRAWATVVFDEAHALKNANTHRWTAANALAADAKIALTGTPIENHTGELHALFDLLAPGMLGTRAAFDRAFGAAIARGEAKAALQLRRLVRPFVLRRTKREVLSELPPKTEILRVVEPTPEHRAFYEALRRSVLERMTSARAATGARANQRRIEMLAEITRLRRAAIDPRLVGGKDVPSGSKIDALVELVLELRAEGRRALVFSQFLEVLDLAGERLSAHSIACRRLDGTMSADARAAEITAFQHGRADVFLLSLKAGGVGMNLTAADFVILLDPWWNPAVEDQAADRAHRIGQSRPVTVARLVTAGTIEEKVLDLHAQKRKLYEDLVAGSDGGGKLDIDTLASLLEVS